MDAWTAPRRPSRRSPRAARCSALGQGHALALGGGEEAAQGQARHAASRSAPPRRAARAHRGDAAAQGPQGRQALPEGRRGSGASARAARGSAGPTTLTRAVKAGANTIPFTGRLERQGAQARALPDRGVAGRRARQPLGRPSASPCASSSRTPRVLIGAHVSTAGGLVKAHERGVEIGAAAIQIWGQSPRMWKPTSWKDADVEEFGELMDDGPIETVVIHAIYLINCASKDKEIRRKSIDSLVHSLRTGDRIGAAGVVLHPGSTVGEPHAASLKRVGKALRHGPGGDRLVPAAAGGHGRRRQHARPHLRGAGRADRAGRRPQAARAVPRLMPPAGQRLRRAHRRRADRGDRRLRARSRARAGCAACT